MEAVKTQFNSQFAKPADGFKSKHTLEKRLEESKKVLEKYRDRIPVVCERDPRGPSDLPEIDKKKYLVPSNLTFGQFVYTIRRRLQIPKEKALFVFVTDSSGSILPATSAMMAHIYAAHKDQDNFLYLTYCFENVFG